MSPALCLTLLSVSLARWSEWLSTEVERESSNRGKIRLYERLMPIKCRYDEKKRAYVGRGRVIGRIAGQMLSVAYALLKSDQETLSKLPPDASLPPPVLYDPAIHRKHRAGQYKTPSFGQKPGKLIELPPH